MTSSAKNAQAKRQQQTFLLIGVVMFAVVAVVLAILSTQSLTASSSQPTDQAADGGPYAGIARGVTEEGWPRLGSVDAPVAIHEYASFVCSHCADFHDETFPLLLEDVRSGRISFVYVPTFISQYDVAGTVAAICALDQGYFWEMSDRIYADVPRIGAQTFSRENFLAAAGDLGLDAAAFETCLDASETLERAQAMNQGLGDLAQRYPDIDITGTPTLTFNGVPPDFGSGLPTDAIGYIRQRIDELSAAGG